MLRSQRQTYFFEIITTKLQGHFLYNIKSRTKNDLEAKPKEKQTRRNHISKSESRLILKTK